MWWKGRASAEWASLCSGSEAEALRGPSLTKDCGAPQKEHPRQKEQEMHLRNNKRLSTKEEEDQEGYEASELA